LTFYAVRVAVRPPDRDHPVGHGKAEHLSALGEAAFLVLVSGFIVFASVRRLVNEGGHEVDAAWYAIAVLVVVIAIDASRTVISLRTSRRFGSPALAPTRCTSARTCSARARCCSGSCSSARATTTRTPSPRSVVAALVISAAVRLMRENVNVLDGPQPGRRGGRTPATRS
jgi:divalent metal cation (Fe/Co/Zn/Cd) transporter